MKRFSKVILPTFFGLGLLVFAALSVMRIFLAENPENNRNVQESWEIYSGEIGEVVFTFDYPSSYKIQNFTIEEKPFLTVSNFNLESLTTSRQFRPGEFLLILSIQNSLEGHRIFKFQEAKFADVKAKKFIGSEAGATTLVYYLDNLERLRKDEFFVFDCHTSPVNDKDFFEICPKIAKSFKFVN